MKKEGGKKIKLAVIISIVSVIITIISLIFSFYIGMKDTQYKETLKGIQMSSADIQRSSALFQENSKNVELAQQNIFDRTSSCDKINKYVLNNNLKLLSSARNSLINNDYDIIPGYLNEIDLPKICYTERNKRTGYIEISILALIWTLIIICLIIVLVRNK